MHELALAESVLALIEEARRRERFAHVRALRLEIGALAGVEPDALRTCLEIVLARSLAGGAELQFDIVPGQGFCMDCGCSVSVMNLYDDCPRCGGPRVQTQAGTRMRLSELRVE